MTITQIIAGMLYVAACYARWTPADDPWQAIYEVCVIHEGP